MQYDVEEVSLYADVTFVDWVMRWIGCTLRKMIYGRFHLYSYIGLYSSRDIGETSCVTVGVVNFIITMCET
jgi:hypothetical protein